MTSKKAKKPNEDALVLAKQKALQAKSHPYIVPVITILVLFVVSSIVFIGMRGKNIAPSDAHVILFAHDNKQETLPTRAKTVGEFLERTGVKLEEGDVVEPAQETEIVEDNFRVNVYRARPITIVDGGKKTFTLSAAPSTRTLAEQAGVTVYPEDVVEREPARDFLRDGVVGEKVVIARATPTYLNLYGTQVTVRTHAKTVGDLLKEKNVNLETGDTVQPAQETLLTPQSQVFVTRSGVQIATVEEPVAAPSETVEDASLSFGATVVRQKGTPGKRVVTYQIETTNGVETSRKVIQSVVTVEPVKQIVARGKAVSIPDDKTSIMRAAGIAESDFAYVNYIISRESGWCPTKLQGQIGYCPAYAPASVPSGLGYGLGQATPGTKMAPFGADWMTNPVTQLRWATSYAVGRYGSWEGAYNKWQVSHYW